MASIERTAYPRFPRLLTPQDLQRLFTPAPEEIDWVCAAARGDRQLPLLVQLKCFQYLHYFIAIEHIPPEVVEHISASMGLPPQRDITYPDAHRSLYRHHEAVRKHLGVKPFAGPRAHADAQRIAREVCRIVNTRIDVINILIAELVRLGYELPMYSALLKLAERAHEAAEGALYRKRSRSGVLPLVHASSNNASVSIAWRRAWKVRSPGRHVGA